MSSPVFDSQNSIVLKSSSSHSSAHTHEDLCSPFCQCSCCAIAYTFVIPSKLKSVLLQSFTDKPFASYVQPDLLDISLSVWQPPKIVANC